jgi:hypothetical protein
MKPRPAANTCKNKKAAQLTAKEYQLRFDQTATIALPRRRYVIAPMPKKPEIIIEARTAAPAAVFVTMMPQPAKIAGGFESNCGLFPRAHAIFRKPSGDAAVLKGRRRTLHA